MSSTDAEPFENAVRENVVRTASAMMQALRENQLDQASCELESLRALTGRGPDDADILVFRVLIAIQRGQAREALQYLSELGEGSHPELRVLCLHSLQDPYWEGLAHEVANGSESAAAQAMSQMLACHAANRHSGH
jgi:predicted Zn-dependent protease